MWCWHCCHSFEGEPLSLPYRYDDMRNKFSTMGNFCSWGCMKTFNFDKHGVNNGGIISGNIVIMRKKLYGLVGQISRAPDRFALKEFGGNLTIEEFRKFGTRDTIPRIQQIQTIEKKDSPFTGSENNNSNTTKLYQITDSKGSNEPLRLKRPKPLKRNENNLEKTLVITRKKVTTSNSDASAKT